MTGVPEGLGRQAHRQRIVDDMSTSTAAPGQRVRELHGQRAVILGGTSGIGLATAKAVTRGGAEVTVISRQPASVTAASIRAGRVGEADDIAHAYLYCLTQPFATGSILTVDGGTALA
jgi:NAD(P)-dependent dehydrogenase (short-subunit alcohol dehydrogenase family)